MKNLKKLERDGLLKSDSYGVKMEGKEKFWRILASVTETCPKRQQEGVLKEMGVEQTPWKIHSSLYEHEKACTDVFVSLALTGALYEWQGEGDQKAGFRHDRLFRIGEPTVYLEMEMGNHGRETLRGKVEQYIRLYRKTGEPFNALFSFQTEPEVEEMVSVFAEYKVGSQYGAVLQSELVTDPLNARVTHRFDTVSLSKYASNYIPDE